MNCSSKNNSASGCVFFNEIRRDGKGRIRIENIVLFSSTKNIMEVHHHSHKPKNWREYITEFIMLFTAVTLGFFAENLREHQIIEKHKIQNLSAMINDLQQDSIEIENRIGEYTIALKKFEQMKDISFTYQQKQINENKAIDSIVTTYINTVWDIGLFINNASYKNTIASGSLSYIKNNNTKQLIAQYYEALYSKLLVNNKVLDEDASEFLGKTFSFGFMTISNGYSITTDVKMNGQTRSNFQQIEDFKSIPALRKVILAPEFRMYVNKIEGRSSYYLYVMHLAKELNNKLLLQLKKNEF